MRPGESVARILPRRGHHSRGRPRAAGAGTGHVEIPCRSGNGGRGQHAGCAAPTTDCVAYNRNFQTAATVGTDVARPGRERVNRSQTFTLQYPFRVRVGIRRCGRKGAGEGRGREGVAPRSEIRGKAETRGGKRNGKGSALALSRPSVRLGRWGGRPWAGRERARAVRPVGGAKTLGAPRLWRSNAV
jgi:hypothetical protein